jgi:DNA topoisomerase IA
MSLGYRSLTEAERAAQSLGTLRVLSQNTRMVEETAPPPYTTLTLLEDAAEKFGWSGERSMNTAQSLFEQGLITYPRSDSTHVAQEAVEVAHQIIREEHGITALNLLNLGAQLLGASSEKSSGAHEAIRPTDPRQGPEETAGLLSDQAQLYGLIRQRFIGSQMRPARYQVIEVELESESA